jgi:hypothetical protein
VLPLPFLPSRAFDLALPPAFSPPSSPLSTPQVGRRRCSGWWAALLVRAAARRSLFLGLMNDFEEGQGLICKRPAIFPI